MPIFQSATFEYSGEGSYHDIRYLRINNTPSQLALHAKLAALEGGEGALVTAVVQKHGEASRARATRGVHQVVAYWRAQDGDAEALRAFVVDSFVADPQQQAALLQRFSATLARDSFEGLAQLARTPGDWQDDLRVTYRRR